MTRLIQLLFSSLLIFFIFGCENTPQKPLKVGMCQWPGYEPLFLAAQLNFFDRPVKILRFSSPPKAYQAFKSGAIDVVGLTADELLKHSADNNTISKVFLILDISNGGDAVVAKPSVKDIHDIKGKRVAVESSVLGQYMLQRTLDKAELSYDDVEIHNIEIVDQPKAYKENRADLFVTFEPSRSLILQQGGHVIFDSSMIPNEIVDALAARQTTWENSQESIHAIKRGWYKALDYIQQHPDKAYEIMGKLEGISAQEFKESLNGLKLGTKELNEQMITQKGLIEPLNKLKKMMKETGIIKNDIDTHLFIGD